MLVWAYAASAATMIMSRVEHTFARAPTILTFFADSSTRRIRTCFPSCRLADAPLAPEKLVRARTGSTRTCRKRKHRLTKKTMSQFEVHHYSSKITSNYALSHCLSIERAAKRNCLNQETSKRRKSFAGIEKFAIRR